MKKIYYFNILHTTFTFQFSIGLTIFFLKQYTFQLFTEFECRYDGNILEDFSLPTEDQCKTVCSIVPKCTYYVYDAENGGCECRDSKATQECDLVRGPQKPSYTNDCGVKHWI